MGQKGNKLNINPAAINQVIVFANQYRQGILESIDTIEGVCAQMTNDDTLNGGDGEEIKQGFMTIAAGCKNLEKSIKTVIDGFNQSLVKVLDMLSGKSIGDSTDTAKKAANQMGVLNKE